ncbi:MAG: hypothetical protein ACJ8DZ_10875, partial [Allosphingosinicella sp.]
MKSLVIGAALVAATVCPSIALAAPSSPAAKQSVYRSETTTIIENSDGSETVVTTYTSYYIF